MKSPVWLDLLLLVSTFVGTSHAQSCTNSEIAGIFFGTFLCTLFVIAVAALLFYVLFLRKLLSKKSDVVDIACENDSTHQLPVNIEEADWGKTDDPSIWGLPQSLEQIMSRAQITGDQVSPILINKTFGRSIGFRIGMKNDQVIVKHVENSTEIPHTAQISPGTRLLGASIAFDDMPLQSVLSILDLAQTNRVEIYFQNNMEYSVDDLVTAPLAHFVKNYMLKTSPVENSVKATEEETTPVPDNGPVRDKLTFTATVEKALQRRRTYPHVFLPNSWSDKFDESTSRISELKSDEEMIVPTLSKLERSAPSRDRSSAVDDFISSDTISSGGYKFSDATKVVISMKELKNIKTLPMGNSIPYFGSENDTMEVLFRTVTRDPSLHTKSNDDVFRPDSALSFMSEETLTGSLQEFIDIDIPGLDKTTVNFNRSVSIPAYGRPYSPTTLSISTVNTEAYEEGTKYPVNA